jgi:hypothetical protein
MIEALPVQRDQINIQSAMFGMAARAFGLIAGFFKGACMETHARLHSSLDFGVAIAALESGCAAGDPMAGRAFRHSFQARMGARKRSGRNLGPGCAADEQNGSCKPGSARQ